MTVGSNVNPRSMFGAKIRKNVTIFHLKISIFTAVKYYSILYGRVFVMWRSDENTFNYHELCTLSVTRNDQNIV